jgi:hypothetical protein
MTSWSNDTKPSVIEDALWTATRYLWDSGASTYIEYPWQFTPSNIWTNEAEG